ncbi:MAG: hypothetical protein ABI865_15230 [Nitrosospira sp.]
MKKRHRSSLTLSIFNQSLYQELIVCPKFFGDSSESDPIDSKTTNRDYKKIPMLEKHLGQIQFALDTRLANGQTPLIRYRRDPVF